MDGRSDPNLWDAVIVGGGPAGVAAAITLQRHGWRVTILEQREDGEFKVGEGLIPAAARILAVLGAPDAWLDEGHIVSAGNASAWGSSDVATMDFIRSVDGHGWHLDRAEFDSALRKLAVDAGVDVRMRTRMYAFEREGAAWRVECERAGEREVVEARWLVDATGRSATIARRLGFKRERMDGLLAHFVCFRPLLEGDLDSMSFVESVESGWWYTAGLPNGSRIVIFFTDHGLEAAVLAQTMEGFLSLLVQTAHVADKLAAFQYVPLHAPQATDASSGRLPVSHGAGWIAAGDAAMAFDPLSSQGIYTALYAGLMAANALIRQEKGESQTISNYQAQLDRVWEAYLTHWQDFYGQEKRWPESPFWKKRIKTH